MITIKDYAKNNNVTYEAVRKQIKRYEKELDGHITKKGRLQFLDEFAVEFLNTKRRENPVIVINQERDDYIKSLEAEINRLRLKLEAKQDKLLEATENAQNERNKRLEIENSVKLIESSKKALETKFEASENELKSFRHFVGSIYIKK